MNTQPAIIQTCRHPDYLPEVKVFEILGRSSHRRIVELKLKCKACGAPFEFQGLPAEASTERPTVSPDGLELRVPIQPGRAL